MKAGALIAMFLAVVMFIVSMPLIGRAAAGECNITTTTTTTSTVTITTDLGDVVCFSDIDQNGYFGDVDSFCITNPGFVVYTDVIQWLNDNTTLSGDSYGDPWVAFVMASWQYDAVFNNTPIPLADYTAFADKRLIIIEVLE